MKPVFKIVSQGDVEFSGNKGYLFLGNEDVVCFYIDPVDSGYVEAYTSEEDCPVLYVSNTEGDEPTVIVFTEFPGWKVHSTDGGKSIAVTLVRCAAQYNKAKQ